MAWIELHQSVFRHGKTRRAAGLLRISRITLVGHLTSLWCWALDALPPSGGPVAAADIALGAEWPGDPDRLLRALLAAGYIEQRRRDGLYYLHDWDRYAGRLHQRRILARERKRRERVKTKLNVTRDAASPSRTYQHNQHNQHNQPPTIGRSVRKKKGRSP